MPRAGSIQGLHLHHILQKVIFKFVCHPRQHLSGLFAHYIFGVPVRPVGVSLPEPFLVLPVGLCRTKHRLGKILRGCERGVARNAPGQPSGNFLQHPAIAVRILERNKGLITKTLWLRATDPYPNSGKPARSPGFTVKYLGCLDALRDKLLPGRLDIGDDQQHCPSRTGYGRCKADAELNGGAGTRWRVLDQAKVVADGRGQRRVASQALRRIPSHDRHPKPG